MTMLHILPSLLVLSTVSFDIWKVVEGSGAVRLLQTAVQRSPNRTAADISAQLYDKYLLNEDYEKINLMLLLDSSTSMGETNFVNGRDFLSCLVAMMPREDFPSGRIRTAMWSFSASSQLTLEFGFGSIKYRELVRRKVANASYHNGTSTDLSTSLFWITSLVSEARQPQAKWILIIGTDGKSTDSGVYSISLPQIVLRLQAVADVEIFAVALGTNLELQTLSILTSGDLKRLYPLRDFQKKEAVVSRLLDLVDSS